MVGWDGGVWGGAWGDGMGRWHGAVHVALSLEGCVHDDCMYVNHFLPLAEQQSPKGLDECLQTYLFIIQIRIWVINALFTWDDFQKTFDSGKLVWLLIFQMFHRPAGAGVTKACRGEALLFGSESVKLPLYRPPP